MRKAINLLFLFCSYLLSLLLQRPIIRGYPGHASIEPTNHCNLRCPECPTGQLGLTRPSGSLPRKEFERIIDQLSPWLAYLTLYFQGEPYLNKELFGFISYARKKGIYVWTSTNGHFLTESTIRNTIESGLNKLIISLDGTDQETYEEYRVGGSFGKVVEGIREFVRIRQEMGAKRPILEIQFLVLKSNQHQVKEIKKLGRALGIDKTVLKTAQFYGFESGNPLMPEGKWSRYRVRDEGRGTKDEECHCEEQSDEARRGTKDEECHCEEQSDEARRGTKDEEDVKNLQSRIPDPASRMPDPSYMIKNSLLNRCFRMWSGCVITWDGKVVPCCFDKDADHCLGDLKIQSFKEIWQGEKYQKFRQAILRNRKSIDICRNCSQRW